jgi:hypothetical protein
MWQWLCLGGALLLSLVFVWMVVRRRTVTYTLQPVSQQWLTDQKKLTDDASPFC